VVGGDDGKHPFPPHPIQHGIVDKLIPAKISLQKIISKELVQRPYLWMGDHAVVRDTLKDIIDKYKDKGL
jgi:hypothetical protein